MMTAERVGQEEGRGEGDDFPQDFLESLFGGEGDEEGEQRQGEVEVATPADIRMLQRLSNEQQDKLEAPVGDVDLDDLLAESMVALSTAAFAKQARQRLRTDRHKLTPAEVEALEADIERHEIVQNWEVVGAAVAFTRTVCACGKQHTVFEAMLERQQHRRDKGAVRWHRVREAPQFARREVVFHEVRVPVCADCAFEKGWDLRNGEVKAYESY